jgi:flagellin
MLSVNTNISSMVAQHNLSKTNDNLGNTLNRLSTGMRINSARDDAAGLAMSTKLTSQTNGINVAMRNANDGISMAQVAEGSLNESTAILQRMRDLAVQAANGTTVDSGTEKTAMQAENTSLIAELERIANTTRFGDQALLDGTFLTKNIQVGANAGEVIALTINDMDSTALGVAADDISTQAGATAALATIDAAIGIISTERGAIGAVSNRLSHTVSNLGNVMSNAAAANSRIADADIASETANMSKMQVLQQATAAVLAQANSAPQLALSLLR